VENRLEDLRSLFDFILPGYLGSPTEFKQEYRYPIEVLRNREKSEALRKITAPFLLRRLKTDKTIIMWKPWTAFPGSSRRNWESRCLSTTAA
jgi:SNF2 family DNA or RNA helicase